MVRDVDADARMTIVTRFIGSFLQNLILILLKTREARTAWHRRMHNTSSDTAPRDVRRESVVRTTTDAHQRHGFMSSRP
jgi:hypothetical protein